MKLKKANKTQTEIEDWQANVYHSEKANRAGEKLSKALKKNYNHKAKRFELWNLAKAIIKIVQEW